MSKADMISIGYGMSKEQFFGAFQWTQIMIKHANEMFRFYAYKDYKRTKLKAHDRKKLAHVYWETARHLESELRHLHAMNADIAREYFVIDWKNIDILITWK